MANRIVSHNGNSYELRSVKATIADKLTPIGFVPVPVLKGDMFDSSVADVLNTIGVDVELMFRKSMDGLAVYLQAVARAAFDAKGPTDLEVFTVGASMTDAQLNGRKRGSPEHMALARQLAANAKKTDTPDPEKIWWELLPKLLES